MAGRLSRVWSFVRQILSIRSLLQWLGWGDPMILAVSFLASNILSVASIRNGIPWPVSIVIGLSGAVLFCLLVALVWKPKGTTPTLSIISARWGIGGNAYKDVTEIVRSHTKPDSINIPASAGLFGDPYPNTPKQLRVVYVIARQWEVSIKESENLALPEKRGEEQGNPSRYEEGFNAKLAKREEVDRILDRGISDTEYNLLIKLKAAFLSLRW